MYLLLRPQETRVLGNGNTQANDTGRRRTHPTAPLCGPQVPSQEALQLSAAIFTSLL